MEASALEELRDIHLPPGPGFWPPPPGHWVLAAVLVLLLLVWFWQRRRTALQRAFRKELRRLEQRQRGAPDGQGLLLGLSQLLRRVALVKHGPEVAGLSGTAWASHLMRHAPPGSDWQLWTLLAIERYRPDVAIEDPQRLLQQCRRWLEYVCR